MQDIKSKSTKNKYGQYFTPRDVALFMVELADISSDSRILEPSCGEGVFLDLLLQRGYKNINAYEIDSELANNFDFVQNKSFVDATIDETYDLVIGNPPYIRWKNLENDLKVELSTSLLWNKYFNSLCDYLYIFILKSIELLKENGQLIFICPEYWMNTTNANTLRNYMVHHGYFETIYHFYETPIFEQVTVSLVIFKYIKSKQQPKDIKVAKYYANRKLTNTDLRDLLQFNNRNDIEYIDVSPFQYDERWLLTSKNNHELLKRFENECQKRSEHLSLNLFEWQNEKYYTIGDVCDIGNGLVSGLDKAFQLNGHELNKKEQLATLKIIKAKNLAPYIANNITRYIYINNELDESKFKTNYPNFYEHFQKYKNSLEDRYQYNRKINYWEWVFLRNFNLFSRNEKRIFVPCKERISNKNFFRFALVDEGIFPTQDVTAIFKKANTRESIEYILAFLNQPIIFNWLKNNGIIKGNIIEFSEKPLASIPFRKINWDNETEVNIHNKITHLTRQYIQDNDTDNIQLINAIFEEFLNL